MKRSKGILLGFALLLAMAGGASAETIELVTYYPTSSNSGTVRTNSLTVGGPYRNQNPADGTALISGFLGIGTANPVSALTVVADGSQAAGNFVNTTISGNQTTASTGGYYGINVAPNYTTAGAGNTLALLVGGQFNPSNAGTGTLSTLYGALGNPGNLSTGTVGTAVGLFGQPFNNSTGTITNAYGLFSRVANNSTGTITNAYGLYAAAPADPNNGIANRYALVTEPDAGRVGIGTTTPAASALLEVSSTTQGFLPPRMTTGQRDAIAGPVAGLMVYNTSTGQLNLYNGATWIVLKSMVGGGITQVVFGTAGTTVWAVPAGVTQITVEVWGGGGGGGGSPDAGGAAFGHGGGGGGYGRQIVTVTPGTNLSITVGAGGTGQKTNSNPGANGGTSTVSGMVAPPASVSATGGRGGSSGGIEGAIIGRGGTSTATFNISGQDAVAPFFTLYQRAGGAGGNGGTGSVGELNSTRFIGTDGTAPGGGGCGWFARSPSGSNNGAVGRVVLTYS